MTPLFLWFFKRLKMVRQLISELKSITIGQLFRMFTSVFATLAALWIFAGPFVKSYAADALLDVLIQQGVDPKAISEMQAQGIKNGKDIGDLGKDNDKINEELNLVQRQNQLIINKVENSAALLEQLLKSQLNRTATQP